MAKSGGTWKSDNTRHDTFVNLVSRKTQSVDDWKAEQKAYRAQQRNTTGVYDPSSGTRTYAPTFKGRQKRV